MPRKGAGVAERDGLENRCTLYGYRGFESLPFRKKQRGTRWINVVSPAAFLCIFKKLF